MSKYISTKTYEIINDIDFFEVDDDIAEIVSILNKKDILLMHVVQVIIMEFVISLKQIYLY